MKPRFYFGLLWIAACGWTQTAGPHPVTLTVHLVLPCAAGATPAPLKMQAASGPVCLERQPFLTQDDVATAEIQPSSKGHPMVFLTFHHDAAVRELQITLKNIGNRVAIVLNGRVVGTPVISAASRLLYIDADYTREQAEAVVGAFNKLVEARKMGAGKQN
jgi:hypothetical protein